MQVTNSFISCSFQKVLFCFDQNFISILSLSDVYYTEHPNTLCSLKVIIKIICLYLWRTPAAAVTSRSFLMFCPALCSVRQQHIMFPSDHPSEHLTTPRLLNCGERTATGVTKLARPLTQPHRRG